jgi:hypothetical protein
MGGFGWSIGLQASEGAAPLRKVRDLVIQKVVQAWWSSLEEPGRSRDNPSYARTAVEWIDMGIDSLLTVGVHDYSRSDEALDAPAKGELTFWSYDTVSWPKSLAEHWLRMALATTREELEPGLAKLGYKIAPERGAYPSLKRELFRDDPAPPPLFFSDEGKIGLVDREVVTWLLTDDGGEVPSSTPVSELKATGRKRLDAVLASGRCGCPWCERLGQRYPAGWATAKPWSLDLVDVWCIGYAVLWQVVQKQDGATAFYLRNLGVGGKALMRSSSPEGPFVNTPELFEEGRHLDAVQLHEPVLTAWTSFLSSKRPLSPLRISRDFGASWEEAMPTGIELGKPRSLFADPYRPGRLFAGPRQKGTAELFQSDDGGRSWTRLTETMSIEGARIPVPMTLQDLTPVPEDERLLFARVSFRNRKTPEALARSEDGGASWRALDVPAAGVQVVCAGPGALDGFATRERRAVHLASSDGGTTWTERSSFEGEHADAARLGDGTLLWSAGGTLRASSDRGSTWQPVAELKVESILPDRLVPTAAWLGMGQMLFRVKRC